MGMAAGTDHAASARELILRGAILFLMGGVKRGSWIGRIEHELMEHGVVAHGVVDRLVDGIFRRMYGFQAR